jgi:membrane protease YdiL (CAAX protease family)
VLAWTYLALTAKPISLRRLMALFATVLVWTNFALVLAHTAHAPQLAIRIAISITLLVWSAPAARAVYDTTRSRKLQLNALKPVSGFIRWSYGFALALLLIVGVSIFTRQAPRITLACAAGTATIAIFTCALIAKMQLQRGTRIRISTCIVDGFASYQQRKG